MGSMLFWLGALVVVSLLAPLLKVLIAAIGGKQIGASALSKQPDQIHLEKAAPQVWKQRSVVVAVVEGLASRGFREAGVYTIHEMPGLVVQLLACDQHGFYAAVYEHPQAGSWYELFSRFQDGTSVTYSTSRPNAIKPRPGHPTTHIPGAVPSQLMDHALSKRPRQPLVPVSVDQAVAVFEAAYAESIAYRKQVGISRGEVVGTAMRKAA
jgi:hypothetical protein